jgi:hypothetical protein
LVWRNAAEAVEHDGECVESYELDPDLLALYRETRREVLKWLAARGRGVMGPPPGGVGTR